MSIQYGNLAINAIKYCNPQGELKDVARVIRNGVEVWSGRQRTDNCGVWSLKSGGQVVVQLPWNAERQGFGIDDTWQMAHLSYSAMAWTLLFMGEEYSCTGDQYSTELTFARGTLTAEWSST